MTKFQLPDGFRRNMRLTVAELAAFSRKECGELLVDVREQAPQLAFGKPSSPMVEVGANQFLVRLGLVARLLEADRTIRSLIPNGRLFFFYGYRHPEVVRRGFERQLAAARAQWPSEELAVLRERASELQAAPEAAEHPMGGAVDVALKIDGTVELESLVIPEDEGDWTVGEPFSKKVSRDIRRKRLILRLAMMRAGFAPTIREWWHFTYGTPEWAFFYGKQEAFYTANIPV